MSSCLLGEALDDPAKLQDVALVPHNALSEDRDGALRRVGSGGVGLFVVCTVLSPLASKDVFFASRRRSFSDGWLRSAF